MDKSERITIRLEGLPEEGGHLRFGDFLRALEDWRKVLSQFDHLDPGEGESGIYYRVVDLSHSSPATIVLEPQRRPAKSKSKKPRASDADVRARPKRLVDAMKSIRANTDIPEEIDTETLVALRTLTPSQSRGIASASIAYDSATVVLDNEFNRNISRLIEGEEQSFGSIEGRLEAINLHAPNYSFWIYPPVGPTKVHCRLPLSLRKSAKEAFDQYVRITGRKHYRAKAMFPHMIDVKEIEILDPQKVAKLSTLGGILTATGDVHPPEDTRDEW